MSIREKSIAELIDSLITVSQKCWHGQEDIMDESLSEHDRLQAAIKAQKMNDMRTQLMIAINESLGQGSTLTEKTYHTYFEKGK
jgi:hypothetical protein